jgi:F-box/leucine-rich repeat protein 2/20
MAVAQSNPGLTALNMCMSTCDINEEDIVALSQQYRGLTEVGFPRETTFAAASAAIVAQNWPSLQKLDLFDCDNVTDEWVAAFSLHWRGLREFTASSTLTDVAIRSLALNCPGLRVVDIQWASGISDEGVTELSRCKALKLLNVQWCPRVSDASIVAIAQRCKGLRSLQLGRNDGITDESIHALSL